MVNVGAMISPLDAQNSAVSSPDSEQSPINPSLLFGEFRPFDSGRIPPRISLRVAAARQAIRDELMGLLAVDKGGIPIAKLRRVQDETVKKLYKIHTAMVVKLSLKRGFKSRLCLLGDQQNLDHSAFASAPTDARDFMRWLITFLQGDSDRKLGPVDISKAFAQSDYLHPDERIFAWIPGYLV